MKKLFVLAVLNLFAVIFVNAQSVEFGVTGGLLNNNTDVKLSALGITLADVDAINKTGFYIGGLLDIGVSETFHVQPELTYGSAGDLSFVYLPIMAKYYVAQGFHVMVGPQFSFSSNVDDIKNTLKDVDDLLDTNLNVDDALKSAALELGFGAGYDITEKIGVLARYSIAMSDRYDGPLGGSIDVKNSTLNVGVTYKF